MSINDTQLNSLISLHTDFWERRLKQPIINFRCSQHRKFKGIKPLHEDWIDKENLLLQPEMLTPERHQNKPFFIDDYNKAICDQVFNVVLPYLRIPWLPGIVGCRLLVSAYAKTIWVKPSLPENWYD